MIVTRTPYRLSFFGGGTDFPVHYREHGGRVLATAIDKHCYLTCRRLPPFFEHSIRIVWSKIECCNEVDQITHPAVRAVMKHLGLERGIEIHHIGDLPARSGMGTSSAFTVGLLNALSALGGNRLTKETLAKESIRLEQEVLQEAVGSQDQVLAAHGGLNVITFETNGEITVSPLAISPEREHELSSHLMLFYTSIARTSAEISEGVRHETKTIELKRLADLVDESAKLLAGQDDIARFGEILREGWQIKRSLSPHVTNPIVDEMFSAAYAAGATGGKLVGAGGGGFLLLFVPPKDQAAVRAALGTLLHVPFAFETDGSRIIFADNDADYSAEERARALMQIEPFRELSDLITLIPNR